MRHAKSSWDDASLCDHDRPLNARGRHAAQQMADAFVARDLQPDAILCSSAVRAQQTMSPLLDQLRGNVALTQSRALYEAQTEDYPSLIMQVLRAAKNPQTIMLVGHNFAIQDAATNLAISDGTHTLLQLRTKFPTGAAAIFELPQDLSECKAKSARLIDFLRPRDL